MHCRKTLLANLSIPVVKLSVPIVLLGLCLGASLALTPAEAVADTSAVVIALVNDGPAQSRHELEAIFQTEIMALTEGELNVEFAPFAGSWSRESILGALERAYADPKVDLVLVTGLVANQILGNQESFDKPTFLPLVLDPQLFGLPQAERGSGQHNLNYLTDNIDFSIDLEHFLDVAEFRRLGLLVDAIILDAVQEVAEESAKIAEGFNVEIVLIPYSDPEDDLLALVPDNVDAVMVGNMERLSEAAVDRVIQGLIERKLPSFSFAGDSLVQRGILTADASDSDFQRLGRRLALNVQAVMLGEKAEDQPIRFDSKRRRFINMQTARAIDVWPRFEILVESILINEDAGNEGELLTLPEVAERAVEANLDLLAQRYGTEAGAQDIREARASLLPQVSAGLTATQLDGASPNVAAGAAQRSTSGAITVNQILWSEPHRANIAIQEQLQINREAELESFRLDTVLQATVAFLDILRAETQLRVQRDNLRLTRTNLELARDRVRVGSANASDVYRWESELATAQQTAISAYSSRARAKENLLRVLHRPLTEPFRLDPPTLDKPHLLLTGDEYSNLIDNPKAFRQLMDMMVFEGLGRAPELVSLRAVIATKNREILSARRSFFSPTVSLQGQVSQTLEEDRPGGSLSLEGESDWSLTLSASLALFSGGSRRAQVTRAELELQQLEAQLESTREKLEQNIRSNMHLMNASFLSITLAKRAAVAAENNLTLIRDSYSQGVVSIIELLDAQNAALQANQGAANALFDFLVDLMNGQRAFGRFDFFLDEAERQATRDNLITLFGEGQGDEH